MLVWRSKKKLLEVNWMECLGDLGRDDHSDGPVHLWQQCIRANIMQCIDVGQ